MIKKIKEFFEIIGCVILGILACIVAIPLIAIIMGGLILYYAAIVFIAVIANIGSAIAEAIRK